MTRDNWIVLSLPIFVAVSVLAPIVMGVVKFLAFWKVAFG